MFRRAHFFEASKKQRFSLFFSSLIFLHVGEAFSSDARRRARSSRGSATATSHRKSRERHCKSLKRAIFDRDHSSLVLAFVRSPVPSDDSKRDECTTDTGLRQLPESLMGKKNFFSGNSPRLFPVALSRSTLIEWTFPNSSKRFLSSFSSQLRGIWPTNILIASGSGCGCRSCC